MKRTLPMGAVVVLMAGNARADLVTHALVAYGDSTLVTVENFGASHAAANNSYTSPGSFSGTAEAWAAYGHVRAIAGAEAQNTSFDTQLVLGEAAFTDSLIITGGSGAGFIVYQFSVTGTAIGSHHAAHAHAFLRHGSDPDEELGHLSGNAVLTSLPHSFTFGASFTMGFLLTAEIHLHHGHTGNVLADFSAGGMLTGISVFDAQMNPVSGFHILSGSGTNYPLPEPAAGLVFIAAIGSRRRR